MSINRKIQEDTNDVELEEDDLQDKIDDDSDSFDDLLVSQSEGDHINDTKVSQVEVQIAAPCETCKQMKEKLHDLRMKNIALRDSCNKLRAQNIKLKQDNTHLKSVNQDSQNQLQT